MLSRDNSVVDAISSNTKKDISMCHVNYDLISRVQEMIFHFSALNMALYSLFLHGRYNYTTRTVPWHPLNRSSRKMQLHNQNCYITSVETFFTEDTTTQPELFHYIRLTLSASGYVMLPLYLTWTNIFYFRYNICLSNYTK